MAERSGFFPYVSGDSNSEYDTAWLAKYIASFIGNGVYNGDLAVSADGSTMSVTLPAGRAWINGYHYRNDGALALPVANADGVLNRKDTIVLRLDINARSITAQVLQGTPASSAIAPTIVRTAEQYDLKLCEVSIPAGTTAITQALITDMRLDNSVCGIVTGVISQVDTTTFYNQIAADLAEFKSQNETGFTAWFDGIKDILDSSTAGNLLNMIQTHEANVAVHIATLACTKSGTVYALTGMTATVGKVPVMFAVPTAYAAGDTVTIDGTAYTLKTTDGTTLTTGAWAVGVVTGVVDVDAKTLTVASSAPVGSQKAIAILTDVDCHTLVGRVDYIITNTDQSASGNSALNYPPESNSFSLSIWPTLNTEESNGRVFEARNRLSGNVWINFEQNGIYTGWKRLNTSRIQTGSSATPNSSGNAITQAVTFPSAFSGVPIVCVTPVVPDTSNPLKKSDSTDYDFGILRGSISATGFTIVSNQVSTITYDWIAIGT